MEQLEHLRELVHELVAWTEAWAHSAYATPALFAIAFAESSFFPVPPDVLLIALALANPAGALWYALVCTVGSVLGGILGYVLGRHGGRPVLQRLFSEDKIHLVQGYYQRYDIWAVGLAGFTPVPYKLFSISAGTFVLDFPRFVVATVLGRGGRFFLVGLMIYFFGAEVRHLLEQYLDVAIVLFTVLLIGGFWFVGFLSRRAAREAHEPG